MPTDRTFTVLVIASPPNSLFTPDDTLAAAILRDLASSRGSLAAVANAHGVSIADLAVWLDSPDARQRIAAIERGSYVAVRLAATLNLPSAVDALTQILNDFRDLAQTAKQSGIDHNDPAYLRAAIQARRAAAQLCRLSRAVPIDESHIKDMLTAARARAAGSGATGCVVGGSTSAPRSPSSPASPPPSAPQSLRPSVPVPSSPARSFASSAFTPSSPPLRNSVSSAPSAFSSSSTPCPSSPSKLGDSLAERTPQPPTRAGPQDRRGLLPADLIRAATGPPLPRGSSP